MLIQFVGGIGDALLVIFQTDHYLFLDTLKGDETVHVDCVAGNPRLPELVQWHPKRSQIILSSHDLEFPIDEKTLVKWNLPTDHRPYTSHGVEPKQDVRDRIVWHPRPEDRHVLERVIHGKPYVVFSCAAGHPLRNIPIQIANEAAVVCRNLGLEIVQVGSTYNVTSPLMACVRKELPLGNGVPFTNLIDELSVPGSLKIVDHAKAVFTCYSSMLIEAWFRRKPAYVVYPDGMEPYIKDKRERFSFGMEYPETETSSIGLWSSGHFAKWLERVL